MTMNTLFANNNETGNNSKRALAGTTQLVSITDRIALDTINKAKTDEDLMLAIAASMTDMSKLDELVDTVISQTNENTFFLYEVNEQILENMLKSQQSKRSRCKSKAMSEDNYRAMFSAAAAEYYIRQVLGREKSSGGRVAGTTVEYTDERLTELAADQEALRKEIRNVQSKKSIMKSKAGFTEEDERWQSLLVAEAQLKSVRIEKNRKSARKQDTLREDLREMLAEVNPQNMKAAELKELLQSIKDMVWDGDEQEEIPVDTEAAFDADEDTADAGLEETTDKE